MKNLINYNILEIISQTAGDFLKNFCKLEKFLAARLLGCTIISKSGYRYQYRSSLSVAQLRSAFLVSSFILS